ncbi:MAG: hypothetical protein JSW20_06825 [Nitrospiraceae bacterium]|nr:MAG: hypothetical protein JSW20_06825 [Nitrospiraceae bacterium]
MQNNLILSGTTDMLQPSFQGKSKLLISSVLLVFFLVPLYFFSTGGFQIVDIPIALLMIYVICTLYKYELQLLSLVSLPLSAFALWAVCINMWYYASSFETVYIKASLQTIYTSIIFIVFSVLFLRIATYNKRIILYLYYGILLSLIVPLAVQGSPEAAFESRQVLTFSNPNQLASYTISIIAITLILSDQLRCMTRREKFLKAFGLSLVLVLAHYYIFIAASRAGIASMVIVDIIMLYRCNKVLLCTVVPVILTAILFTGLFSVDELRTTAIYKKFIQKGSITADLEKRTTGRLNSEGLQLLFGAGKKNKSLGMKELHHTKEIHNTFLDIIYSYGLIGGCVFALYLYIYLKTCIRTPYYIALMFSILPLAMTHNLIRFRILWIFLALVFSINLTRNNLYHPSIEIAHGKRSIFSPES